MEPADISTGCRTVTHVAQFIDELKQSASALIGQIDASDRGYFTPEEEDAIRAILVSYWQSRGALLELIHSYRDDEQLTDETRPRAFLVALAAALILVDAARFIREQFDGRDHLRRKWNEPAPAFGIPGGTYDTIQKSLVSARHAWHLYYAHCYFDENQAMLRELAAEGELSGVMAVIDRLIHRLDVSVSRFTKTKLRVRSDQMLRSVGRNVVMRAMYGIQKLVAGSMAGVYVRPGHEPGLPADIAEELHRIMSPGDVLIVRKEYAITNYFLPGFWPHAALYLGDADALTRLGVHEHENVQPRWASLLDIDSRQPRRVLESMKDGVHIRSLQSPFDSDSIVVLRPQLDQRQIAEAIARGMFHEGKPYDFAFDFNRSDRLVCTEVIYRSYEGVGDIEFPLNWRVGRLNLSGGDLIGMALRRQFFDPVVVFSPTHAPGLVYGDQVDEILRSALGC